MTTIDMILHCPKCGVQHVDAPELNPYRNAEHYGAAPEARWMNPPHRSHLCHGCGCVWRPADVPTNGVQAITTRGEADTWPDGVAPAARVAYGTIAERAQAGKDVGWWDAPGVETGALSPICTYPACGGGCDDCPGPAPANGVPVAHPTDGERDLAALCVRLVRRLREVSPDDKLAATATDYLNQRRYLNPLRIKALEKAAPGVSVARDHTASPSPTDGGTE